MFNDLFSKVRAKTEETVLVFENAVELEKWKNKLKENCPNDKTWGKIKFFTVNQVQNGVVLAGNTKQLFDLFVVQRGKYKLGQAAGWVKNKLKKND